MTAVLGRKQQGIRFVAHMAAQVLLDRPEMLVLDRNSVLSVYGDVQIATSTDFYFAANLISQLANLEKFAIYNGCGLVSSVVAVSGLLALFATPVSGVCIVSDNRTHWMPATTRLRRLVGRGGPKPQPGDDSSDEYRRTRAGPRTSARHPLPPPGGGPTL